MYKIQYGNMKRVLLLAIIALQLAACAHDLSDPKVRERIAKMAIDEQRNLYPGRDYSGWAKSSHENGQLEKLAHYIDGDLQGPYINWRENGEKSLEANYKRGRLTESITWKPKGIIGDTQITGGYGVMTTYHDNGGKSAEIIHNNGKRHGDAVWWHDNAQVSLKVNYQDGAKTGIETQYHKNGNISSQGRYENSLKQGDWTQLHSNGDKSSQISFNNGFEVDTATWWYQGGVKSMEINYIEGKLHGPFNNWYANGMKSYEASYDNGDLVNAASWKHDGTNGETNIVNGVGVKVDYYDSGRKSSQIKFKRGKRHGYAIWWNENGEEKYKLTYENGKATTPTSALDGYRKRLPLRNNFR